MLSSSEYVLNKGALDGVSEGMRFQVSDERLRNLVDPETGEDLGDIERDKGLVEVVAVGPKASLTETVEQRYADRSLSKIFLSHPRGILDADGADIKVGDVATWVGAP